MPTTVVKSIGTTSRDYSTLQSWEDASPSDLTTSRSNTCTGGTTSTIILDVGASATNDFYTGHAITNASAEQRLVTAYNGTTKIATIGALNGSSATWTAPTTGQAFTLDSVIWQGQSYNDSEFTSSGAILSISGETTDATRYLELTAGAGQSFQDSASVRTNALKYNQANGVAIRKTAAYNDLISIASGFFRINKVQLKTDSNSRSLNASVNGNTYKDLIITGNNLTTNPSIISGQNDLFANVLVFLQSTSGVAIQFDRNCTAVGIAAIRTTDASSSGTAFIFSPYGTSVLQSSCCFGFATVSSGAGVGGASSNNATDLASGLPGSSNQFSVTFNSTSPFTNSTVASQNSIPVSGTNLSGNGFRDATNAPNDITGTVRSATPTIGVWELVSAVTVLVSMWNSPPRRPVDNPIKVVGY